MAETLDFFRRAKGPWRPGRRAAGRLGARSCSRPLIRVGAVSSDTLSLGTLAMRFEKTVAGRPGVAVARKISRNPLKTLIPRPGSRPFRGAIRAVGSGWSDTSAPGRLTSRPEKTAAGLPGGALARKISRNPLKTLIPRPGFRAFREAIRAVGSGCSDNSSPAMLTTRPEKTAAGRPGGALARRISRNPLKTSFRARVFEPSGELSGRSGQAAPTRRLRRRSRRGPRRQPRTARALRSPGESVAIP